MRLKEDFHHSIVIERSEFICYLHKCLDEVQAKEFIQQIRRLHPEANHHCYAYIAGQHNELQRSNDAGEPSGTAGVPMLEALKLSGLQDCCAVTVRYFGGIKLGAGGLVRAYSRSVSETVKLAPKVEMVLMDRYTLTFSYDLIGKLVGETGLTRKAVVAILTGIEKSVFEQFKFNPEEFIIKAAALINDEKATAIIQHITYNVLDEHYDTDIFTEPTIKGKLGTNAMKAQRHLYDHIVYDSTNERDFAADLDTNTDVAVYVKLPDSFYIATPVGHYNPDWAIAFYEGTVKHIYFVAETKGSMSSMQLRLIEESKIHCAREHFKAISNGNVVYDVVDSYQTLLEKVMK